jgi:polysaccharide export outer membrane protein
MVHIWRKILAWLLAIGCIGFLAQSGASFAEADDVLGPGDAIRIVVFENPDLTADARISARGNITFPLIGVIKLDGLTPAVAAAQIATKLKDGNFIRDPRVSVSLVQLRSRQVSVLGQVTRPGRYVLEENNVRLTDVLALAGGIAATGDEKVLVIRSRQGGTERLEVDVPRMYQAGDLSSNVEVENGDTVFVNRAPVFYIYGQVQRAGTYRLESGMSVMQAISLGGGLTRFGTERGLKINRRSPGGAISAVDAQPTDVVKADDIIFVSESFF